MWRKCFNIFSFPVFWSTGFLPFCPGFAKQVKETSFTRTLFVCFVLLLLGEKCSGLLWQMNSSLFLLVPISPNLFCLARLGGKGGMFALTWRNQLGGDFDGHKIHIYLISFNSLSFFKWSIWSILYNILYSTIYEGSGSGVLDQRQEGDIGVYLVAGVSGHWKYKRTIHPTSFRI